MTLTTIAFNADDMRAQNRIDRLGELEAVIETIEAN